MDTEVLVAFPNTFYGSSMMGLTLTGYYKTIYYTGVMKIEQVFFVLDYEIHTPYR